MRATLCIVMTFSNLSAKSRNNAAELGTSTKEAARVSGQN
jgi:hypothetical protein